MRLHHREDHARLHDAAAHDAGEAQWVQLLPRGLGEDALHGNALAGVRLRSRVLRLPRRLLLPRPPVARAWWKSMSIDH